MAKKLFQSLVKYEIDTDTGAIRVLSKFTTEVGAPKRKPKKTIQLVTPEIKTMEL